MRELGILLLAGVLVGFVFGGCEGERRIEGRGEESEREMAVRMGRAAMVEEGYRLAEYRLVGVSNEYWKGPEHWTVTFKPDRLLPERPSNTPVGTGGEVFVHVNVESEEWYLTLGE
ncbi:MAG: hypothetical protein JSV99_07225 [Planctomycetota bacterium]|nr:MAG: hypothetical protein JSV99_07225 [Planctomycetota bacterium]